MPVKRDNCKCRREEGAGMEKLFMNAEDIAADLDIGVREAKCLMSELQERIKRKGGCCIAGLVQTAYYEEMKAAGFLSDDGAAMDYPLTEKRLLRLKEFCAYSGLGQNLARKFAKQEGIEKRIGRKALYDRVLFDEWCNENRRFDNYHVL